VSDGDHKGMFAVDNQTTTIQPTKRFESVALIWELIADGYRVETHGDYTEITGLDPTGRAIKKLIVTANKRRSPILVEAAWHIIGQSRLQGTESWIVGSNGMNAWYGAKGGPDSVIPNTGFDWVRYDIEVQTPPTDCSVTVVEPYQGVTVAPGGVLDIVWDLEGYLSGEVYLSIFSGWNPAQYYFHGVVPNDGYHAWSTPMDVDPSQSYTVYVESAAGGARSGHCWSYGAFDVVGPFAAPAP
jgi:hypothetical protein